MTQTGQHRVIRDSVIVGLAMFAVFFGAGNLIFPPQIGFLAGTGWNAALLGLLITGMLLPVLSVVALGLRGGTVERLCAPIAPWFGSALLGVTMLGLAWLIAVPRTASVAFETGFRTLAPALDPEVGIWLFVPLFFVVSTYSALDRSRVIDRIGRVLTPLLLGLLGIIVIWSIVAPLGVPADTGAAAPFRLGLLTGYQTGDVFGGIMFGIIFIEAFRDRGYTPGPRYTAALWGMALVTFLGLFFVYGGLEFLGATGSGVLSSDVPQAGLLTALVGKLAGGIGANTLAVAVLLACLTTAVGATAVLGEYIQKWTRGRVSYRAGVLAVSLTSLVQAFGGVDYIVALAEPIFLLLYPVGIAIVILGLLPRRWLNDGVWKGATLVAILMGVYDLAASLAGKFGVALPASLQAMHDAIPLASAGFAWLVPAVLGGLIGGMVWKLSGQPDRCRTETDPLPAQ
ncbi:branched-chain amino acid transport system II carrier protein [Alloyangia pacifica]|uniref:Branched-chain amino acid transport system carrier protein n=1 Tax=Alloyangia pacifica TaxID=311180 RepID=A0A1I6VNE5_9RHOB|nr:branched-chain amino acid transport system II carrier protein [Alloyangia pacifica]SDI07120.1 branched-chain amino acid:cation transporter, LIVCS family [Alloyangia pacifica]SFT15252.1 branched-chain amino acid:cation transporter, LIVCS family [Alloyangia pacifica]